MKEGSLCHRIVLWGPIVVAGVLKSTEMHGETHQNPTYLCLWTSDEEMPPENERKWKNTLLFPRKIDRADNKTVFRWWDCSFIANSSMNGTPSIISRNKQRGDKEINCSPTLWRVFFQFLEVLLHQKSHNVDMLGTYHYPHLCLSTCILSPC